MHDLVARINGVFAGGHNGAVLVDEVGEHRECVSLVAGAEMGNMRLYTEFNQTMFVCGTCPTSGTAYASRMSKIVILALQHGQVADVLATHTDSAAHLRTQFVWNVCLQGRVTRSMPTSSPMHMQHSNGATSGVSSGAASGVLLTFWALALLDLLTKGCVMAGEAMRYVLALNREEGP